MTAALHELLARFLPGAVPAEGGGRISIRAGNSEIPVSVHAYGRRLLQVEPIDSERAPLPSSNVMLRLEVDDGSLRVEVPVEVFACGRTSLVLRTAGSPLVMRRRTIRDQALEEALGVRAQQLVA